LLGGLALVAGAAPLSSWLGTTSVGAVWGAVVDATMGGRPGGWRLVRGGLAYLAIPALAVLLGLLLWVAFRRSPRAAVVLAAVTLLANVSVQTVKHTPFGFGERWVSLNPLSGHAAVVAAIGLGWLVVAPIRHTAHAAAAALALVGSVGTGVVLAGWHTPYQVLCPLLICAGWAIVGAAAVGGQDGGRPSGASRLALTLGGLGAAVLVGIAVALANGSVPIQQDRAPPVVTSVLAVFAASALVVGIVLWPASRIGLPDPRGHSDRTMRRVER
jgi:hypothetical protein